MRAPDHASIFALFSFEAAECDGEKGVSAALNLVMRILDRMSGLEPRTPPEAVSLPEASFALFCARRAVCELLGCGGEIDDDFDIAAEKSLAEAGSDLASATAFGVETGIASCAAFAGEKIVKAAHAGGYSRTS